MKLEKFEAVTGGPMYTTGDQTFCITQGSVVFQRSVTLFGHTFS